MEVIEEGSHIHLGKDASLLQVAVGEVSRRVVNQDDVLLDLQRKGDVPQSGGMTGSEEDATHAPLGCIH